MKKLSKEECKSVMLDILEYINEICNKNNISYSIMYGTLIGAIRHGGMIPWDDDIDISLRREDYYKLIELINNDKKSKYKIITWDNDPKYCFPWAKVIDTTTILNEKGKVVSDNYGLFVDVFPYDRIPNSFRKLMYLKRKIVFFFIKSFDFDKNYKEARFYYLKLIRNKISRIFGKRFFFKLYDNICKKYNCNPSLEDSASPYIFKQLKKINYNEFDSLIEYKFDGKPVLIFKNYDSILREYYGDYMQIPSKEQQHNHSLTAYWRNDV